MPRTKRGSQAKDLRLPFMTTEDQLSRIVAWQKENGVSNRAEALRALIDLGLPHRFKQERVLQVKGSMTPAQLEKIQMMLANEGLAVDEVGET